MRRLRATAIAVLLVCLAVLGHGYATGPAHAAIETYETQASLAPAERTPVVEPREDVTVVAGHGQDGGSAALTAFGPDGTVVYRNDTHDGYFDVDPVDAGRATVEYVAERSYDSPHCNAKCTQSLVERVNLTTGEVTRRYSRVVPQDRGANWHDVDRLSDHELLVGDIHRDGLYVVDTETGLKTWEWSAQTDFPLSGGGEYPADWSHLNDVERLPDGRYMTSLRNQDLVAFVDPETGLQSNWTLGADGEYGVLYEQHNPDYIPEARGGPAVVVADSLNDRVIEYQREDGGERTNGSRASSDESDGAWEQSWVWSDEEMLWPRDADRLPNGNTLIADTNNHRVVEVDPDGEIVWEIETYSPYDVERLATGDESAGGPAASAAELTSREREEIGDDPLEVAGITPRKAINSVSFVLPVWMGFGHAAAALVGAVTALAWLVAELRASSVSVSLRWPVRFR
ncbi:arylsulfotransferase family protein [Halorussus marinus]|uniref:arylsulfotransferase family protein n=1 Tax=Halorussus marinus TaxID=2505976 RepID=UPI00106DE3A1|nr:arylsulfotransferase family protein [Halorussus marinus]